jgi:hypothetical protein
MAFDRELAPTLYVPAEDRYDSMQYRRCARSGLKLPAISLGLWQNFGDNFPIQSSRSILRRAFDLGITTSIWPTTTDQRRGRAPSQPRARACSRSARH